MPNWCGAEFEVVLPKINKDKFLRLFLDHEEGKNADLSKHLARTWLDDVTEKEYTANLDYIWLSIKCEVAWSVLSCWEYGYPQESNGECPTMDEVCRELKVKRLAGKSMEPGMGFIEYFEFTPQIGFMSESRDIHRIDFLYDYHGGDIESWEACYEDDGDDESQADTEGAKTPSEPPE